MNNKKIGNKFENELAEKLSKKGYWVTLLTPKAHVGSQPCDIIAVKNNRPILIDAKTSSTYLFPIERIEENQRNAFKRYKECGNKDFILAIKYKNKIYYKNLNDINFKDKSFDIRKERIWNLL